MTKSPKVLLLDVESLPNIMYGFDLWNGSKPSMLIKERAIVTFAYKWVGEKSVHVVTTHDFQKGKYDPYNDKGIVEFIGKLITDADYVVGHYSDKFDMRLIRARTLINNLPPLPPVATIDTYKLAKKYFYLNANRLDYLGKLLGLGGKIGTSWTLWQDCAEGCTKALKKMAIYNKRDVDLLEKVLNKLKPYVQSPLNHGLFDSSGYAVCPHCGSKELQKRGTIVSRLAKRQRVHCQKCGSWSSIKLKESANG
jgi:DNA polymerase III epsilon subunit-like protein